MSDTPLAVGVARVSHPLPPIILADDSDGDALIISRLLERAKIVHPIVRCRHGRETILRLIELWTIRPCGEWPCLLLLDGNMPVMDGFAVLQWLRERSHTYSLRTVMLSSSDEPADIERAKSLGAAGYLIKYPTAECLAAIVKSALAPHPGLPDPPIPDAREIPRDANAASLGFGPVQRAFE